MKKANAMVLLLILSLLLVSFSHTNSNEHDSMITRHDKDEAEFIKLAEQFEKYMCHLNLPDCEATIIADQWVITAAHCAVLIKDKFEAGRKHFVIINDTEIEVDKVIMYKQWENIEEYTSMEPLNDIALVHLKTKPKDAMQAKLYMENDEVDKLIYMVGRGDKGDGLIGVNGNDGKQRGATNRIETATERWLTWTFNHPDTKTKYLTEYEGISGPGDSGGPAFIVKDDIVYIAGISSWQDTKDGPEGLYGVVENYTRVSQFIKWINDEMSGTSDTREDILRIEVKPDATIYKPKAIAINASTLKQYVGEYDMQGRTIKIYTKENDTNLFFFLDGFPEFTFIPTKEHHFSSKTIEGFLLDFKNQENGVFKQLFITQPEPDGILKAIRK
ncbi:S1 family peptidase [Winogradskyella echinorum]|uniref:S1 family peptidase n=1 Tax=Winogradskyella echinorum TaxID=538189 RepID=A0ABR6Y469_9FLAO|nr:trypsin-like serine protease [Winogradskyella echinorum]MBC3847539.1 S1 family peptidase [Winogradskyella echinorum]MBC5751887.1 S1 family peptidase [Winogradskyella echinorum]